jgi:hypothetical protein
MDPNALIVAGIVVAAILVARRSFGGKREPRQPPKQQPFRCARCSTSSMHTARTLEAKRRGKTKFFCNSCHGEWLRTQPANPAPSRRSWQPHTASRAGRSGCLGAVVLAVALPTVAVVTFLSK